MGRFIHKKFLASLAERSESKWTKEVCMEAQRLERALERVHFGEFLDQGEVAPDEENQAVIITPRPVWAGAPYRPVLVGPAIREPKKTMKGLKPLKPPPKHAADGVPEEDPEIELW